MLREPKIKAAGQSESRQQEADYESVSELQKGVKHLCERGIKKLPKRYILPVSDRPTEVESRSVETNVKLPIIDFAELQGPNRSRVLKSLSYAFEKYGFFQLVNHGLPADLLTNMTGVCKRLFELPFEERAKYMSPDMRALVRYGTSVSQDKDEIFCWRDFIKLMCDPWPDVLQQWPTTPADFREISVPYSRETRSLFMKLMVAVLESLGLWGTENETEEDDVVKGFREGSQLLVSNCFPPCPEPDLTIGLVPHSDYGFLTILLQDEVRGLQIQFEKKWMTVEPMPNAFVVNAGDHLEIFSNGRYKSVLHRVVANSQRMRISVATLHSLPFSFMIQPSPKLINKDNPPRYRSTDFATFIKFASSGALKKKNFLEMMKLP
ncbi:hypothetical protein Ancab_031783 [Ancistrocladus abbreviatus]